VTLAYLVNTYPAPSHSFIRREIRALERRGLAPHRFALRSARATLADPADRAEDAATEHLLEAGALRLAADLAAVALARPGRFLAALRLALACGARARARGRHLVYLAEAARLVRRCAAIGARHLHAHFGTNSATVAMLAATLGGPRYSFTVHGPEEFDAPLALSLPDKLRRAAFAVAISAHGRSQLCRWLPPAAWSRLHVVRCGIEPAAFPDPPPPLPEGPLRLVAIGRFAPQKGFDDLVAALALARPEHPGLTLVLVGDGPLRGALEAAVAARGLGGAVRFAGWQDEAGVRDALSAAHLLAVPSFAEGLPVVAMEAMAMARPVIATWIAGIPELVRDGETGWLVPPAAPEALAAALAAAAATPPARLAAMGAAGRARVLALHDADAAAARLAGLFATPEVLDA
jgi:glycosyltransferase involved in cell wall biosynthesis